MKYTLLLLFTVSTLSVFAQYVQNPSYETWEVENGKSEPENWSSIQTALPSTLANFAPQVMTQSSDAHSGTSSIKLENVSVFNIVANGVITNGRIFADLDPEKGYMYTDINDSRWNTPISNQPDSIVGWFKYSPVGLDVGSVTAIVHTDTLRFPDPDSANFVGAARFDLPNSTISTWTRFSVPFTYFNSNIPEYVFIVLNSGDSTQAIEGSIAYFDDVDLIYNPMSISDIFKEQVLNAYGSDHKITIDLSNMNNGTPLDMKIFDIMGKEHIHKKITTGSMHVFENFPPGVYVCVVSENNEVITKKIIVR